MHILNLECTDTVSWTTESANSLYIPVSVVITALSYLQVKPKKEKKQLTKAIIKQQQQQEKQQEGHQITCSQEAGVNE